MPEFFDEGFVVDLRCSLSVKDTPSAKGGCLKYGRDQIPWMDPVDTGIGP